MLRPASYAPRTAHRVASGHLSDFGKVTASDGRQVISILKLPHRMGGNGQLFEIEKLMGADGKLCVAAFDYERVTAPGLCAVELY